jgi:hypothetical protein
VGVDVGVSGERSLGDETEDDGLQQLRYPVRIGTGVERPGGLLPPDRVGEQFALSAVGGAGGRLERLSRSSRTRQSGS